MSYKEITQGEKLALPVGARFIESKAGTMGMEVAFEFEEIATGARERLNWVGWLSEKAIENTMATLVDVLGFTGDDSVDQNGHLANPNAINMLTQVRITVELEAYAGKTYPKIKWINRVGGISFAECKPQTIKSKLGEVNFAAHYLAQKQKSGITLEKVELPF